MQDKWFEQAKKVFGVFGGSLTAIGALLTAVGFLAERYRLVMLGLNNIPLDFNRYLTVGARFVVFLPMTLIQSLAVLAAKSARAYLLGFFLVILVFTIWLLLARSPGIRRLRDIAVGRTGSFVNRHLTGLLFLFLVTLLLCLTRFEVALDLRNVLFSKPTPLSADNAVFSPVPSSVSLHFWVVNQKSSELEGYIGFLFFVTILTGIVLWKLVANTPKSEAARSLRWQKIWAWLDVFLWCTLLVLLPVNFGILYLPNEYPVVSVSVKPSVREEYHDLQGKRLKLLHYEENRFYLYSRDSARVWSVPSESIGGLTYLGFKDVFAPDSVIDRAEQQSK
jgi:hypothetical protein